VTRPTNWHWRRRHGRAAVISIIGRKNAGKTTLTVALAAEFARRGRRVMTLKHCSHAPALDTEGTDSWRHFTEGRAERRCSSGAEGLVCSTVHPTPTIRSRWWSATRRRRHRARGGLQARGAAEDRGVAQGHPAGRIYDPALPDAHRWVAVVTDDRSLRSEEVAVLQFSDTMWIQLLATLAWERAIEVGA